MPDYADIDQQIFNIISNLLEGGKRPSISIIGVRLIQVIKLFPILAADVPSSFYVNRKLRIKPLVRYRLHTMKKTGQIKYNQTKGWIPN